jgi:hypothetical protein
LKWLFGGIIIPLLVVPLLFQGYITPLQHKKQQAQLEIKKLNETIWELFFMDEETFRICSDRRKGHHQIDELNKINSIRDHVFKDLVSSGVNLYRKDIIPGPVYTKIRQFARWNNQLYYAHDAVCRVVLKNMPELTKWRNNLNNELLTLDQD